MFQRQGKRESMRQGLLKEDAIRRHVYDYYRLRERPTLSKVLLHLTEAGLYNDSKTFCARLFMTFHDWNINNRKVLVKKRSCGRLALPIVLAIKQKDMKKKTWLDETWVNTVRKCWTDGTVKETISAPVERGERIIVQGQLKASFRMHC